MSPSFTSVNAPGWTATSPKGLADTCVHGRLQANATVSVNYGGHREPHRGHALAVVDQISSVGHHNFGRCRQGDLSLMFTPCTELAELAGIVPAGVFRLCALESICHSLALFVAQSDRSVRRVLCPQGPVHLI